MIKFKQEISSIEYNLDGLYSKTTVRAEINVNVKKEMSLKKIKYVNSNSQLES